ncbi:hypothetical protein BC628DRAFT_1417259 [Trametes gibbosa]|nr:hypothetical protein BC628DRAFT_1417259 [Trametes gibbosa]
MSSGNSAIIAIYQGYFTENCLGLTVMTIIAFEYVFTFRQEIDYFWRRKITGASALFFMTRYLALVVNIIETSGFAPITQEPIAQMCTPYVLAGYILSSIQYLPWGFFSALRVYALANRVYRMPLSILVLLLSLVPLVYKLGSQHYVSGVFDPIVGCEGAATYSVEFGQHLHDVARLTLSTRICLIAADAITVAVTWYATYRATKLTPLSGTSTSFATILLRHGLIYFVVLLILNVLHLIFTMLSIVGDSQSPVSYLTIFTEPLTAVLIARFLLDLQATERSALDGRDADALDCDTGEGAFRQSGTLVFGRVVGSLASSAMAESW